VVRAVQRHGGGLQSKVAGAERVSPRAVARLSIAMNLQCTQQGVEVPTEPSHLGYALGSVRACSAGHAF
jgi:hypothetical protein